MKLQVKTDGLSGDALKAAEAINEALKNLPEGIGQKELDAAIESIKGSFPKDFVTSEKLSTEVEALKTILQRQGAEMQALKNNGATEAPKTFKDAIIKQLTAYKDNISKLKSGEIKSLGEIVIKAAATMTEAGSLGGSSYLPQPQFLPGLLNLVRNKPFLLDYLPVSNASSARIVWNEQYNAQGTASFIAEGVVKPLISFETRSHVSNAAKIADKIKVSTEMLDDIPFIAGEINKELAYKVNIKTDTELLSGAGGDGLNGITSTASLFVLTSIETSNPNDTDALRAAKAQLASLNFDANYAFINPIDGANMDLKKSDGSGQYMLPPFTTPDGRNIGGMMVVETNQIPQGSFLVCDTTRASVYNWQDFVIKVGYVNDDFEKNLVTIIGEKRLHFFIPTNYANAFLYDTFANVKTAIAKVAP